MPKVKKTAPEPARGYEAKSWQVPDALINDRDAAECSSNSA